MTGHAAPDIAALPTYGPSTGVFGVIQRGLDAVNTLMAVLSAIAIAVAGGVLTWEVIGRYYLSIPSDWQDELSTFLLVGATFASAGWTQARRGHVGIDALAHVLPPAADAVRRRMADLVAFAFCAFFAWKSYTLLAEAWEEGQTTPSAWGPPLWIPYLCMAGGMALLALQLALQVVCGQRRTDQQYVPPPLAGGDWGEEAVGQSPGTRDRPLPPTPSRKGRGGPTL